MADAPGILIIRLSAIGDIVMASPLVDSLRARYPRARIAWLVQAGLEDLVAGREGVDEVIAWPRSRWQAALRGKRFAELLSLVRDFRGLLRSRNFDMVLDLQGLLKSGLLAWMSGAPRRVGLGSREGSRWLMTEVIGRDAPEADLIGSEYRHLAARLGCPVDDFGMRVPVSEAASEAALKLRRETIGTAGYAVFCPFTTRPQKHWFNDAWEELAEQVARRWGVSVLVLGGPGDRSAAEPFDDIPHLVNLVGRTRLQEAAALIRDAAFVVGVDTGLTHMAHAFRRPAVCLFGSTKPYLDAAVDTAHIIYHDLECAPCKRRPTCGGAFTCMRGITANEVAAHLADLLEDPA
ncbi:MAG: glycosyltransferase family 9 protein [Pseudomonadota bacterium]